MPHIVTREVKANEVRKGDFVLGSDVPPVAGRSIVNNGELVIDRKRGTKNVTIETTGGNITVHADAGITIQREEQTDEEKQADRDRFDMLQLRKLVDDWASDPTAKIRAQLDKFQHGTHSEALSHWDVDQFLASQAQYKVGVAIQVMTERFANHERFADLTEDERLVTAAAIFIDEDRSYNRNPLSRSTSITSNIFEDLDTWAKAEFLDKLRWGGLQLVQRRLAELKANDN